MKTSDLPHLIFLTLFLQLCVFDHWFFTQFRNHYIDRWIAKNKQLIICEVISLTLSFSVSLQIQWYWYWNRNSSSFPWQAPHMKCTSKNRWSNKSWRMIFECLFAWCDHPKIHLYSYLCGHVIETISMKRKWHTLIL